jgi:hypothetical protein
MKKLNRPDASIASILAGSQKDSLEGSSRIFLEASDTGIPISIGTSAVKIHTASKHFLDETYVWASNYSSADTFITMSYASDFSDHTKIIVPIKNQSGLILVIPGTPIKDCSLYAKASVNNAINVTGFALRYYRRRNSSGKLTSGDIFDGTSE